MRPVSIQFFLNHMLEPEEVARQTQGMANAGYQTVAGHARAGMLAPFMSEHWWNAVDAILRECRKTGMHYCIWDEDYFPSGHAGGRVVWSDCSLICGQLDFHISRHSGSGPFEADFDSGQFMGAWAVSSDGRILDISRSCGTRRQDWGRRAQSHAAYSTQINFVGNPHWRTSFDNNKHAAVWIPSEAGEYTIVAAILKPNPANAPDILNPAAVARFIEYCYEPYFERYPDLFGNIIDTSFTDEPSPGGMTFPWTPKFAEEFESEHGYNLLHYLPHLGMLIDKTSPVVRHHYRQTQHRLQSTAYLGQLADWCTDHDIEFTGHLTRTEWLSLTSIYWPNELRCYKQLHVPCCDPLGAACAWPDASSYSTGVKVVSSAAHLFGKAQAGSDALAVIGDEARLRDMKFMLDFQMVLGVNAFMLHGASYSLDGPRKDEVPPSLSYHHSEWPYFHLLNEHIAKTCQALTEGEHLCSIAMLYPSTSLYCQAEPSYNWYNLPDEQLVHGLVDALLSRHKDFDFIDETTLSEQTTKEGLLTTPESYTHLILPYLRYIDFAAAEALERLAEAGTADITVVGSVPEVLGSNPEIPIRLLNTRNMQVAECLDCLDIGSLPGHDLTGEGADDVFVLKRLRADGPVTFLFNRAERAFCGQLDSNLISIEARGSRLLEPGAEFCPAAAPAAMVPIQNSWSCKFSKNTVPLNFWHVAEQQEIEQMTYPVLPPGFDLMNREPDFTLGADGIYTYTCRFYLTGELSEAAIVMDKSAVTGDWSMFVNDQQICQPEHSGTFDCLDMQVDIGEALRSGTTPALNTVKIVSAGPEHGLHEVMYLVGDFNCEYRYGHLSSPYISASSQEIITTLQDWRALGHPTYSAAAVYTTSIEIDKPGDYLLDMGRVEDIAAVSVDHGKICTLAWPPYACTIPDMQPGTHVLQVSVTNSPANRTRAAGLAAGLLGPVSIGLV